MRIQRAELAVYNARAVDLLNRWQEDRVSCGDVDAIARPQPNSMAALLGYEAEAITFGLEDPPCIRRAIERFGRCLGQPSTLAECRKINSGRRIPSRRAIAGAELHRDVLVAVRNPQWCPGCRFWLSGSRR